MLLRRGLMAGCGAYAAASFTRPARATQSGQVLFAQPSITNGIAANLGVNSVLPPYQPVGQFFMHFNQNNPFTADNNLVSVHWDAGRLTGLSVPAPAGYWERGIWNPIVNTAVGRTVAQVYGPVVGAYLNSRDLINGSPDNRFMIAPSYIFPTTIIPFSSTSSVVGVSFDLQVPTASNERTIGNLSNAYIKLDMLFQDKVKLGRMSLSGAVFANGFTPPGDSANFDDLAFVAIASALVGPGGKLVTVQPGSATHQASTWTEWLNFNYHISYNQFAAAIALANTQAVQYGYTLTPGPENYVLLSTHLNAEMHYTQTLPSTMGWSMQNLTITQVS